jgi:hypothetical protein
LPPLPLVIHELLKHFTGDARLQAEKILGQPFNWNRQKAGAVFERGADQVYRVAIIPQLGSLGSALQDAHAVKLVALDYIATRFATTSVMSSGSGTPPVNSRTC